MTDFQDPADEQWPSPERGSEESASEGRTGRSGETARNRCEVCGRSALRLSDTKWFSEDHRDGQATVLRRGPEGNWNCRSPANRALEEQSSGKLTPAIPTTRTSHAALPADAMFANSPLSIRPSTTTLTRNAISTLETISSLNGPPLSPSGATIGMQDDCHRRLVGRMHRPGRCAFGSSWHPAGPVKGVKLLRVRRCSGCSIRRKRLAHLSQLAEKK